MVSCNRSVRLQSLMMLIALIGFCTRTMATVYLEDAQLVATTPALLQAAPQPKSFSVATAEKLRVTLSDLGGDTGVPAKLTSLSLVVVSGSKAVLNMSKAGVTEFDAIVGNYS